eukprot:TRINITY_DN26640_c0_g2_i1.p1 TRINITY_DN26640_c0_g2~~TRINITY_DN26640_c0_g2_i1.p1  ORF type:complete len:574 (+),score=165.04 TRINITY_DN26640_c0_g2_i1:87-1724(+)
MRAPLLLLLFAPAPALTQQGSVRTVWSLRAAQGNKQEGQAEAEEGAPNRATAAVSGGEGEGQNAAAGEGAEGSPPKNKVKQKKEGKGAGKPEEGGNTAATHQIGLHSARQPAPPPVAGEEGAPAKPAAAKREPSCPKVLDLRTTTETVRALPTISWRAATAEDIVIGKPGIVQGQDQAGGWYDLTVTAKAADGTYSGVVRDRPQSEGGIDGMMWTKVWLPYLRVKVETPPPQPTVTVTRSACAAVPASCAWEIPDSELTRIDAPCAASLPAGFWSGLSNEQLDALPVGLLDWQPSAAACGRLTTHAVSRMRCGAPLGDECVGALSAEVLEGLPARCTARISPTAFAALDPDRAATLVQGGGGAGLTVEQMRALPAASCGKITQDWNVFNNNGQHGIDLCLALPRSCWSFRSDNSPDAEGVPPGCLAGLSPDAIKDLSEGAAVGKVGPDAYKMCNMGQQALAQDLTASQRAALSTELCAPCLLSYGGTAKFPQCAEIASTYQGLSFSKLAAAAVPAELTFSQQGMLALCSAGAFLAGFAVARRREG